MALGLLSLDNMPRKILIRSSEHPYHISARCINKDWFRLPIEEVWKIFEDYLYYVGHAYDLRIHSFVLMSNHFHLLASTPKGNLDRCMNYLMREVSRNITRPYHWTLVDNYHYYMHTYKYVYRNPVEAGICENILQYPYSTLAGRLGFQKLIFPVTEDLLLENDVEGTLDWLSTKYEKDHKEAVRKALKKQTFKFAQNRDTKRPHELEGLLS